MKWGHFSVFGASVANFHSHLDYVKALQQPLDHLRIWQMLRFTFLDLSEFGWTIVLLFDWIRLLMGTKDTVIFSPFFIMLLRTWLRSKIVTLSSRDGGTLAIFMQLLSLCHQVLQLQVQTAATTATLSTAVGATWRWTTRWWAAARGASSGCRTLRWTQTHIHNNLCLHSISFFVFLFYPRTSKVSVPTPVKLQTPGGPSCNCKWAWTVFPIQFSKLVLSYTQCCRALL